MGFLGKLFSKPDNKNVSALSPTTESPKEPEKPMLHVPSEIDDCTVAYKYEGVEVAAVQYVKPNFEAIHLCDRLIFVPEPENEYDKGAIKILCAGAVIGYVHKNKLQSMVHDWLKNNNPIFAAITAINKENNAISFFIAFYKNPLEGVEKYDSINASLTKTSKKDILETSRQEYLELINENDILILDYNDYDEDYLVSDSYGNELGELSKSISIKLKNKENEFDFISVVQEVTENDNGKYGASLTIYFKPKH